jgi:uncharacterized protein
METKNLIIPVSESIGVVSGIILEPGKAKDMLVLAHGAGAGMHHTFMDALANRLYERAIASFRFNFPFTENSKKRPDPPQVAEKTVAAVLNKAHELYPQLRLFAAGKSFGGRMTSQYLSKNSLPFIEGIVFYGFPLHPAGEPGVTRAEHLYNIKTPLLFLQGTKDSLADLTLLKPISNALPTSTLMIFEGADHSFNIGKKSIVMELADATERWLATRMKS